MANSSWVAASSSFQTSRDVRLMPGDTVEVEDYTITYAEPSADIWTSTSFPAPVITKLPSVPAAESSA